jgi:uncharacterized protein (DUF433 family)
LTTAAQDLTDAPTFEGIYDVPEAARYIRAARRGEIYTVGAGGLIRWIRRGLASPDLVDVHGNELLLGFEDLISMRVIVALRAAKVSWHEIRGAESWLRKATGAQRPFATETLWTGQGEVFADWSQRLVSASLGGQLALDLLRQYLIPVHGLKFNENSSQPVEWEPFDDVVLDPLVQFGAPCIRGTRIPTRTVWGMVEAGDSPAWVAEAYGLSQAEVLAAGAWESRVQS